MKRGKYQKRVPLSVKKSVTLLLALVLTLGCVIGGTIAWLTAESGPVTNVFTTSNIGVTLEETKGAKNGENREFKMVPGWTIEKDPKATVTSGSEDCYLFVKVEKSANFDTFMTYAIADGWTPLNGVDGVYYRVFDSKDSNNTNAMGTPYSILANDTVTVKGEVTKGMMTANDFTQPTMTFTAYAHQLYQNNTTKFDAATAWSNLNAAS